MFGRFTTSDGEEYERNARTGVIRRVNPKIRGKAAVKAHKKERRALREWRAQAAKVRT